jgi:LmbE family N-acetylglucosaminyl deacetylase
MDRRHFLSGSAAGGMALAAPPARGQTSELPANLKASAFRGPRSPGSAYLTPDYYTWADDLVIERNRPGKPHQGKVLAAIQAHSDDITLFAAGTVAKLIDEGYTGYLIRLSNDEKAGKTVGYGVVQNEIDNREAAKALGCRKAYSFYYRNHRMDDCAIIEIRQRLIFLFRLLQVNTVFAMDPYDHYDENPDHLVVGKAVETACWMATPGGGREYPEQLKAGLKPAHINEKYYHSRAPQGHNLVDRVVDISSYIDQKVRANVANKGKGPAGDSGARLRQTLAKQGKKLPLLGGDDESANFHYVKHFLMEDFRTLGRQFGLEYAETFRYIGPEPDFRQTVRKYVDEHVVLL